MTRIASPAASTDIVDPELPIVDCHHHLWIHPRGRYLIDEFQADLAGGHNVVATVFAECNAMYRQSGPEAMRPVGEAEFVAGVAAMSGSGEFGPTRMCAGFIGYADMMLGAAVDEVLHALAIASGGRLRGIRAAANWDTDPSINAGGRAFKPRDLLLDPRFRAGIARLAPHQLVYDAFQYHPQLPQVCDLADAFPDLTIVVNHCGGLLGIGRYATADNYASWKSLVTDLAQRPNVLMKLGGLGGRRCGFGFEAHVSPPPADTLAAAWEPYIETCIDLFGPDRCMFESNFPPDNHAGNYRTVWNALKLTAAGCSASEKAALFSGTAARVYRLDLD
jgi:predicted TIM-barrel fold metal-dependent hydrolase